MDSSRRAGDCHLAGAGLVTPLFPAQHAGAGGRGVRRGDRDETEDGVSVADLSLGGSLNLNGLDMNNVKDYSAPKILVMKSCGWW